MSPARAALRKAIAWPARPALTGPMSPAPTGPRFVQCLSLALFGALMVLSACSKEQAPSVAPVGELEFIDARAGATPAPGLSSALYFRVRNLGAANERIESVRFAEAAATEMHSSGGHEHMQMMRPTDAIEIPAHGEVELKPGGDHIMLIDLQRALKDGETVQLELKLERGGAVMIPVRVTSSP